MKTQKAIECRQSATALMVVKGRLVATWLAKPTTLFLGLFTFGIEKYCTAELMAQLALGVRDELSKSVV